MSNAIWKFPLSITDIQEVQMPSGATVLTVQMQRGGPCLWAMVDTEARQVPRAIYIHGTGHTIYNPDALRYIGTFQVEGALVFHVFENKPPA